MSDERLHSACLDDETLAALVDGCLADRDRHAAIAHLSSCGACRELLADVDGTLVAMAAVAESPAVPVSVAATPAGRRSIVTWLAAAAVVVLAAGMWWWAGSRSVPPALAGLSAAPRETRFADARLSLDENWRPASPVLRAGGTDEISLDVRAAAARVLSRTDGETSAEALHARGLALLATGDWDGSVNTLERAVAAGATDPAMFADVAAARLERFRRTGTPGDAAAALQAADRALAMRSDSLSGLFNRAAALEALGQRDAATAAWRTYLAHDSASSWSDEVRRRMAR